MDNDFLHVCKNHWKGWKFNLLKFIFAYLEQRGIFDLVNARALKGLFRGREKNTSVIYIGVLSLSKRIGLQLFKVFFVLSILSEAKFNSLSASELIKFLIFLAALGFSCPTFLMWRTTTGACIFWNCIKNQSKLFSCITGEEKRHAYLFLFFPCAGNL